MLPYLRIIPSLQLIILSTSATSFLLTYPSLLPALVLKCLISIITLMRSRNMALWWACLIGLTEIGRAVHCECHYSLGLDSGLCKEDKVSWAQTFITLCSCYCNFQTVIWNCEPKQTLSSLYCFCQGVLITATGRVTKTALVSYNLLQSATWQHGIVTVCYSSDHILCIY